MNSNHTIFQEKRILSVLALHNYNVALFVNKTKRTSFPSPLLFSPYYRVTLDTHQTAILICLHAVIYMENS